MKRNVLLALMAISMLLFMQGQVSAQVECSIRETGCDSGEEAILELTPVSDSSYHAAVLGYTNPPYPYKLCCKGYDIKPGTGLNEQTGLKLSSRTNAHVCWERPSYPCPNDYTDTVAFYFDNESLSDVTCSYKSSCDGDDFCILSFIGSQGSYNAHVADCETPADGSLCCSLSVDTEGPRVENDYDYPGEWVVGAQSFDIKASDDGSGVKRIFMNNLKHFIIASSCSEVEYDKFGSQCSTGAPCTVSILDDQNFNDDICYYAEDNAGNKGPVGSVQVMVDNSPPSTSCTNCPLDGSVTGSPFTVTLAAIDQDPFPYRNSGVLNTYLCVSTTDDCLPSQYEGPVTISTEGIYHIRYFSVDWVDNTEDIHDRTVTYDSSLPVCDFISNLPGTLRSQTVPLEWTANDSVSSTFLDYKITAKKDTDGDLNTYEEIVGTHTITTESQTSYNFQLTEDGHFQFQCVVTYERSGTAVSSAPGLYTVLVDTENPAITLLGPNPEYTNQETFTISWSSDDTTIDYYELSIDGSVVDGNIPATETSTTYHGADGQSYDVSIVAYDLSGNPSDPAQKTVHVDTQAPVCSMTTPSGYVNTTNFGVSWSSPETGALSYDLCINNDGLVCTAPSPLYTGLTTATQTLTGSNGNTYYISCRATDQAGNTGDWSSPVDITIDTVPPSLDSSQYTAALTSSDSEELLVNITVSDEVGIDDVSLIIGTQEVSPTQKSGSSGDTEWTLEWEIPYGTYFESSAFTITMDDVNGNSDSEDFSYSVSDCNPGDVRACNPLDPAGDAYTQGVCRGTGNRTCQEDGSWSNCTGGTLPTAEDCNELDDDCDGEVDEDLASQPCGPPSDLGICQYGTSSCSGGIWTTCIGAVYPKASETCGNDLDDDCNGVTDDGCVCKNTDPPTPCGESNVGICKLGQSYCVDGTRGSCIGAIYSTTEMCGNTLDDDCDGLTDCEDDDCLGSYLCEGTDIPKPEPFPWWWLSVIGAAILVLLVIVWYYFRSQGEELTWDTVKDKWSSSD